MSKEGKKKVNKPSSGKQVASSQNAVASGVPPPPQVVVTNYAPAVVPFFPSPYSQNATCPQCHFQVSTTTELVNGTMVWASCIALFLAAGVFCCCFIPFCVDDMKDVQHFCPQCGGFIGEYRRC